MSVLDIPPCRCCPLFFVMRSLRMKILLVSSLPPFWSFYLNDMTSSIVISKTSFHGRHPSFQFFLGSICFSLEYLIFQRNSDWSATADMFARRSHCLSHYTLCDMSSASIHVYLLLTNIAFLSLFIYIYFLSSLVIISLNIIRLLHNISKKKFCSYLANTHYCSLFIAILSPPYSNKFIY